MSTSRAGRAGLRFLGLRAEIRRKILLSVQQAVAGDDFRKGIEKAGSELRFMDGAALDRFVEGESERMSELVKLLARR